MTDYLSAAFVLIALGLVLLAAEVLVMTGGLLVVGGLLFVVAGVGLILVYGETMEAALAIGGLAVGMPAVWMLMVAAWRRLSLGRTLDAGIADAVVTRLPQIAELEHLKGRVGKTVTPMRPSGSVDFDGRRVDAMSEGMLLEPNTWVKCVDVKGNKVVVRQMDGPANLDDVNLDDMNDLR